MKNRFIKTLLPMALGTALLISAAGCGKTTQEESNASGSTQTETQTTSTETQKVEEKKAATISFMIFQSWKKDSMTKIFDNIKTAENVSVDLQVVPDAQFGQLIKTKVAAGETPDIVTQNSTQLAVLGADHFTDLSNEAWVARLSRPDSIKTDGKIMMMPLNGYSFFGGVWYNKKVFSSLGLTEPTTYTDFLKVLDTVKTKGNGIIPIFKSDKDDWTTQSMLAGGMPIALSPNQQDTIDKIAANKLKVTDVPEMKAVVNLFLDMYTKGYVNKDHLSASWDMAEEAIATGKAATLINGDFLVNDIAKKWPDKIADLGFFPLPVSDKQLVSTGKDIKSLLVSANSKNLDAVKRFLNAFSQPENQNVYYAENPTPVAAFSDCDGGKVEDVVKNAVDKYVKTNQTVYEFGDMMPSDASDAYWNSFVKGLVAGSAGKKTADQILSEYQTKLAEIMTAKKMPGW